MEVKHFDMCQCFCMEVIISTMELRGGKDQFGADRPYRRVTQVFTKDGELIAELDPDTSEGRKLLKIK